MRRPCHWIAAGVLIQLTAVSILAQPSQGKVLIASRSLHDPDFARAVVLLIHYDSQAAVGLMINRRTEVLLSDLFKHGSEPVYAGGPVQFGTNALLRSLDHEDRGAQVLPGVYLIADKSRQRAVVLAGIGGTRFRVYAGYCGWSTAQLKNEIQTGRWHVLEGNADMVFDRDVGTLWSRLIAKVH